MSGAIGPTVASAPTAVQGATEMLATMAALSGVATDYNIGSQIRTQAEAIGAVVETEGVGAEALVLQGMVYGAMYTLGITPYGAIAATGTVTFATSFPVSSAPSLTQSLSIPQGTLVQTPGGITFATASGATMASGTSSINLGVVATTGGAAGNVAASGISGQPLTNLGYPLFVFNGAPTGGGSPAETLSQTLARYTAKAASLGLCSPYAIANAAIGVIASGTGEIVRYSSVYEPWIVASGGLGANTAGFTLFIDNGTGAASAQLIAAVTAWITGSVMAGQSGYRPAGVPFAVSGVTPIDVMVNVVGTLIPGFLTPSAADTAAISAITTYFSSLGFGIPAEQPQIAAGAANAALGLISSLTVNLYAASAPTVPVTTVSGMPWNRIILTGLNVSFTAGT